MNERQQYEIDIVLEQSAYPNNQENSKDLSQELINYFNTQLK
jgi:hypothetical protein